MKRTTSTPITFLFGLLVAAVFLGFTCRGLDLVRLRDALFQVEGSTLLQLTGLCIAALVARGLRWYGLLPEPRTCRDFIASQRALSLSYGVNNVVSRVGEVVRVVVFARDTGRSYALVAASVLADRMVFDSLLFGALIAVSLIAFREPLLALAPQLSQAAPPFLALSLVAVVGLTVVAFRPTLLKWVLVRMGLPRLPVVWLRIEPLCEQLAIGLATLTQPGHQLRLHGLNVLIWGSSFYAFGLCLAAFDIHATPRQLFLVFTFSSLGFLLPSPGGVGTFHYFTILACNYVLGTEKTLAAAAATVCHGVNYLVLSVLAMVWFFMKPLRISEPLDS